MESVRVTGLQFFALNEPPFLPLKDKPGELGYRYLGSDTLQCCGKGNLSRLHLEQPLMSSIYWHCPGQ